MNKSIRIDELLAEWEALAKNGKGSGDGFLTKKELSAAYGWSAHKTDQMLRDAKDAGRLVLGRKYVEGVDGVMRPKAAYQLVVTNGKAKKP